MSTSKPGFTFREMMSGPFALGETDPAQGEQKGRVAGTGLRMHNTISIEDLQAFLADPQHGASLSGTIDFTPFGDNIPAHGIFNLFSPSADPKIKYMIYEMGFLHDGQQYYLAGHKEVREHPLFDVWRDTTTLYTKLYKGTDKNGLIAGAGILSLNPMELLKMVATFRAVNASSVEEEAKTIAQFGKFFLGELWDTYVKKTGA